MPKRRRSILAGCRGWGWENLHYAFTIIHLEGYQFAEYREREMFGGGSESTISNAGRERKEWGESQMKSDEIFKDSSALGLIKCCSNYTLFHVLRHNLHVKCCNLLPFTTVTLRPLKKKPKKNNKKISRSWFPFNESHLALEFSSARFFFSFFSGRDRSCAEMLPFKYCLCVHLGSVFV